MENEIAGIIGAFHDGVIVSWEGDLKQLTLTIECQYLAELFQEGFDYFYLRLDNIELIAFEPWVAAGSQKATSKTQLADIFASELEILSAKTENGIAAVATTLVDPTSDFIGGNLLIKANSIHLQNQNREQLTSADLFAAASRYWDIFGKNSG